MKNLVLELLLKNPEDIGYALNGVKNKKYFWKLVNHYLPTDTGLEINFYDSNFQDLFTKHMLNNEWTPQRMRYKKIKNEYGFVDYDESTDFDDSKEHRIRLKSYKHLVGFKKYLRDAREWGMKVNTTGDVHVHTDMIQPRFVAQYGELSKILMNNSELLDMFIHQVFEYEGKYNHHTISIYSGDNMCVRMQQDFNTIEYRMGVCNLDYTTYMKWIICCHLWSSAVRRAVNARDKSHKSVCNKINKENMTQEIATIIGLASY